MPRFSFQCIYSSCPPILVPYSIVTRCRCRGGVKGRRPHCRSSRTSPSRSSCCGAAPPCSKAAAAQVHAGAGEGAGARRSAGSRCLQRPRHRRTTSHSHRQSPCPRSLSRRRSRSRSRCLRRPSSSRRRRRRPSGRAPGRLVGQGKVRVREAGEARAPGLVSGSIPALARAAMRVIFSPRMSAGSSFRRTARVATSWCVSGWKPMAESLASRSTHRLRTPAATNS